jgi:hypothetical protein
MRCDQYGRPLCPYCGSPMKQAKAPDRHVGGRKVAAFECEDCEAVEAFSLPKTQVADVGSARSLKFFLRFPLASRVV